MRVTSPARLAFAAAALGVLGFAPAAQAATVLANVAGTVVGAVVASALARGKTKASCRLYDRDGREVYLPCDAKRPLGDLVRDGGAATAYAPPPHAPAYMAEDDCGCFPASTGYGAGYSQDYGGYGYGSAYGEARAYYPDYGAPVVSHVAGRDPAGFLTWAGKRTR